MATSGALSTSNGYVKYTISITQNSQSISGNTSNVTVSVRFYRTNTGYTTYGTGTVYCKINGTTYTAAVDPSQKITNSGIVLFSKTLNIVHNSDGSKTLTCSAWINHNAPLTSNEQSFSMTLSTIPRKSELTVESGTLSVDQTLTVTRKSTAFTHTIKFECGSYTGTICEKSQAESFLFTPPIMWANGAPKGTQVYATFTIETFNGDTSIGSNSYARYFDIPESVKPTVSFTVSDASGHLATYGKYIQGRSKLNISIDASGLYGSTISAYKTTVDGKAYTSASFISDPLTSSGDIVVEVTVIDSRGRTATASQTITALAYSSPKISAFTIFRCDASGNPHASGEHMAVKFSAEITALENKNTAAYKISNKKQSDTTYTETTLSALSGVYSVTDSTFIFDSEITSAYDVILNVTDSFSTTSKQGRGAVAKKLLSFKSGGTGIAFGKVAELDDYFECDFDSKFNKGLNVLGSSNLADITANSAYFSGGVTESIPTYYYGDCNTLTESGRYYIGNEGSNKPGVGLNGWLECLKYSTDYCYQRYTTYTGIRYERLMQASAWGEWSLIPSLADIKDIIKYDTTVATWSSISANSVRDQTVTLTKIDGYKPMGIVSVMISGTQGTRTHPTLWRFNPNEETVYFRLANTGTAATGTMTVTIGAIYFKTF